MAFDQDAVVKILSAACAAVEAAKIPEDLRPLAFGKAIDLLAGSVAPSPPSGKPTEDRTGGNRGDGEADDERLGKIARRTGVDVSKLGYIYDLESVNLDLAIRRVLTASPAELAPCYEPDPRLTVVRVPCALVDA
jgi:hypothetical protein